MYPQDIKLCHRILMWRHCNDDCRELIDCYLEAVNLYNSTIGIDKEKDYKIMVLQQENKFLKENV